MKEKMFDALSSNCFFYAVCRAGIIEVEGVLLIFKALFELKYNF
jgi:hypothetical protein